MTQQLKLSMNRPLVGLRARPTAASGPAAPGDPVTLGDSGEWIFRMRDHLRREVERREAFQTCLEGIDRAVESMVSTVNGRLDDVAALITELGIALAREVLGTAIEKGLADPTATVVRCLRDAVSAADGATEVFLAPDDLRAVHDRLQTQPDLQKHVERARFTADPDLERGAVRIETEAGRLLYEPREVLQRISDEVRREISK